MSELDILANAIIVVGIYLGIHLIYKSFERICEHKKVETYSEYNREFDETIYKHKCKDCKEEWEYRPAYTYRSKKRLSN